MIYKSICNSPIGILEIKADEESILALHTYRGSDEADKKYKCVENEVIKEAKQQLQEYFAGERKSFELKLGLETVKGTEFQKQVWNALLDIPYGVTCSYKEMAIRIGNPKAVRAVANAIGNNPILVIIPCHRVIGSNGSLTGFGAGIENKEKLLRIEGHGSNI